VKRIRSKKLPLTAAGVLALRDKFTRSIEPAPVFAAGIFKLERASCDLVNQTYALTDC
jgi:hypothetical protein